MPTDRPPNLADLANRLATLEAKIDAIARATATLTMLLTAPPPSGTGARQVKLTPAQRAEDNKRRAYKARVARAAKRYGLTLQEWVDTYGAVDRLPPGAPPPGRRTPLQ